MKKKANTDPEKKINNNESEEITIEVKDKETDTMNKEKKSKSEPKETSDMKKESEELKKAQAEVEELKKTVEKLQEENKELNGKYLRQLAEFDNFKKRQKKVFDSMVESFREELIGHFLDVLDNFERALDSCPITDDNKGYIEGFELIAQQMLDVLKNEKIDPIEDQGSPFDPNRHEAIHQVETDEAEPGIILETFQKGYSRGEKLIRPAKVIVAAKKKDKK